MLMSELKIATLKLIENDGEQIAPENIVSLEEQENYKPYLLAFNEAFNRGLARIVTSKKLPLKRAKKRVENEVIDLSLDFIDDIYEIAHIIFKDNEGNEVYPNYRLLSNQYMDFEELFKGEITIYYHRRMDNVADDNDLDLKTIGINDFLAHALQFYIKSDLYESDDASKAQYALNRFESYLEQIKEDTIVYNQNSIMNYY